MLNVGKLQQFQIFISFHKDSAFPFASKSKKCLEKNNLKAFLSEEDLEAGEDWENSIHYLIDRTHVFIAILTPGALDSQQVQNEIRRARESSSIIIPFKHASLSWEFINACLGFDISKFQGIEFKDEYDLYRKIESSISTFANLCSEEYMAQNVEDILADIRKDFSLLRSNIDIRFGVREGHEAEFTTWMDPELAQRFYDAIEKGEETEVPIQGFSVRQDEIPRELHTGGDWELHIGQQNFESIPIRFSTPSETIGYDTKCKVTPYGDDVIVLRSIDDSHLDFRFELNRDEKSRSTLRLHMDFIGISASKALRLFRLRHSFSIDDVLIITELSEGKKLFEGKAVGIDWSGPDEQWHDLVKQLAFLEERVGVQFQLPREFTVEDKQKVEYAYKIVADGQYRSKIENISINTMKPEALRICDDINLKGTVNVSIHEPESEKVIALGQTLDLGPKDVIFPKCRLQDGYEAVRESIEALEDGDYYRLQLSPLPIDEENATFKYPRWTTS